MSFTDEYLKLREKRKKKEEETEVWNPAEIAPLFVNKTAPLYVSRLEGMSPITTKQDEEDIAPVEENSWVKSSGVWDDGYQFGDVFKTTYQSTRDIAQNILGGFLDIGEAVVDAGAYIGGLGIKASQAVDPNHIFAPSWHNEETVEKISDFIKGDLYDGTEVIKSISNEDLVKHIIGVGTEEGSVFGEKSDSLAQSGGQLAGQLVANAVLPGSGMVLMATTAFGSEAENALNQGATFEEAGLSAAISAGAEVLTEKIGGIKFGGKTLTDAAFNNLSRHMTNKVAKVLVTSGKVTADALAEGGEEILSGYMGAIGQKLTYMEDKEIEELFSNEDMLEAFIGGAVLGGLSSGGDVVKSTIKGVDPISGLTKNEQKVVEKVYNDELAKKDGKVSNREKTKLWNEVVEKMERGEISTDTIEEVLGDKTYKDYKTTIEAEESVMKELEELYEGDELQQQKDDILNNSNRFQIKNQLSNEVSELVKNDRLSESYNEKANRSKQFEADVTKYDPKYRDTIQKAIDSGILNNTRKTHEFVDILAKISADKNVPVDFLNNQKLKESGFAIDGKQVNGLITESGISINIDSPKAWQSTVGHEITHVLEGTDMYDALQQTLFDYAKSRKGTDSKFDSEYKERLYNTRQLYKDVKGYEGVDGFTKIKNEVTADLVGDYLFTDEKFIKHLSAKNRNVFEKIYDEIKYLCKVATAGSKEARELEKVKKAFEDAYRADGKAKGDTKYSISDSTGKKLSKEQQEYFKDSKMRDENGNLKVMYHGTPNGDFTVFKDGTYFTDNKEYADRYQNPGASSISTGKTASNPKTFEVYLDIKKPFDINDAEARRIYIEDYIKGGNAVGINPYLSDAEYGKIQTIDWTEGEDLREFLVENGYDYDGLVLDEGATGGYGDEVQSRGKSYVVFSPEQVKNVDNKMPTSDPDIRFSLSESVEETKDLMAIHNLTEGKLLKSLRLGGLPMPSVAVAKAQDGHSDFGEISLILPREAIDPKTSRNNKLYSGDAWTPTYPSVAYKVDEKVLRSISKKLYKLVPRDVLHELGRISLDTDNMTDTLNRWGGDAVEAFRSNDALKYAYLVENGEGITLPMKEKRISYGSRENGEIIRVAEAIPADEIKQALNGASEEMRKLEPRVRQAVAEYWQDTYGDDPVALDLLTPKGELSFSELDGYLSDAMRYHRNGVEQTVDSRKAKAAIAYNTNQKGYENWLKRTFSGIVEKEGIRNNKDYFTPSGNRRSFEALHYEHNLENVIKAMREKGEKGIGGFGGGSIFGAATAEFSSVKDMKQASDRLQKMSDEEYQKMRDEFSSRFFEIAGRLPNDKNSFMATDDAANTLVEAVAKYNTRNGIANYLRRELNGWATYSDQAVDDLIELVRDIRNMPTGYFEAKPQRAVSFDEVGVFVIPYDADVKLKQELLNRGYAIAEYDPKVEGDRTRVLNQFEEYKFSLSNVGEQTKYGKYSTPATELRYEAPVQEKLSPTNTTPNTNVSKMESVAPVVGEENANVTPEEMQDLFPDDLAPMDESTENERLASFTDADAPVDVASDDFDSRVDGIVKSLTKLKRNRRILVDGYSVGVYTRNGSDDVTISIKKPDGKIIGGSLTDGKYWTNTQLAREIAEQIAEAEGYVANNEDIAPVVETVQNIAPEVKTSKGGEVKGQQAIYKETVRNESPKTAQILTEEPKVQKKNNWWSRVKNTVLDKGMVFEELSQETGNRELQARWNSIRYAEGKAQKLIGEGNAFTNSLKSMQDAVEKSGKTKRFYEYLYHMHNVDRMTLEERFKDTPNKAVFGDEVTAEVSRDAAAELAKANPEFKQWAEDIYTYNKYLRELLVDGGVISSETAKLWEEMYPHYVPIRRVGDTGMNINVPLDTGRTGVNAPIKRATGGNQDILPLFDTMGQRTIQTYKAIAKNRFGVELKNTLGTTIVNEATSVDEAIDSIDTQDGLLQEGKNGQKPTFTVFENGEKVTFEITEEMYDAMKPTSDLLSGTSKTLNTISNFRRGTLTEYNPWFLLKNAIKDVQDVLINSQHAARTYAAMPKAIKQMATKGHWYQEYMSNGGDQNTYFDKQTNTFAKENKALEIAKTVTGLNAIAKANNIVEMIPRLSEYIASREAKRSVDVAMLDAARVTTNFAAGGDLTKFANRNGFTFLNASVQGAVQQARNIYEAKQNGLKGWVNLAAKFTLAGLPAVVLNHLIWGDDEEYEELSDYVKDGYYIVGKYGDGQFVRIPKGRTVAVLQSAFEQMGNLVTGNDEVDLGRFLELAVSNLAPNNPLDNNILSPIVQVASNKTWYGEDLVPTRLQDLPAAEQYDESTDAISRWLGETFNISPYKANYLLDQYSGVIGDTFLPMLTPEAESGDNSFLGNMIAPLKDMFTTDSVMNNQNVSDFYDKVDELTVNANSSKATDEDVLKYKYINSINADLSELYQQKREIQNSDLADDEKYAQVREIQQQIDNLTREGLNSYEDVSVEENYATVADRHYRWHEPGEDSEAEAGWQKITEKQLAKQEKVTSGLNISPNEYWGNKEEYDYAYDNPEKYAVAKSVGGYKTFKTYSSELYDIKADKDENGKSISGSRKEKVIDYVNGLDIDYGQKIILFKSEYKSDNTYNYYIVDYLNSRNDISYDEMVTILKELGFQVSFDGYVTW